MNDRATWQGIAPSAKIFDLLDEEEKTVLALLAWASAVRHPVTSHDVASLPDRDGRPLGVPEAKEITRRLTELGILSVRGMNNSFPLSVFLGGFRPASARTSRQRSFDRSAPPESSTAPRVAPQLPSAPQPRAPRPAVPSSDRRPGGRSAKPPRRPVHPTQNEAPNDREDFWGIPRERRIEKGLGATERTPAWVLERAQKLRKRQTELDGGTVQMASDAAAEERLKILRSRIDLYQSWLRAEPDHPTLRRVLQRKRKALPELEHQLRQARMPGGSRREQKRRAQEQGGG